MFDLPSFVQRQLARVDIEAHIINACTYADEARFFSYRRTTHRNEARLRASDFGDLFAIISVTKRG